MINFILIPLLITLLFTCILASLVDEVSEKLRDKWQHYLTKKRLEGASLKIEKLSLVPSKYKDRDPRALLYNFPSMPKVRFAKMMNEFYFYKALEAVEETACKLGYILVPRVCMHWKRCRDYSEDRKIKCCGKTYFMMKVNELTESELMKLEDYIEKHVSSHRLAS